MATALVEDGMSTALGELDPSLPARGTGTVDQLYEFGTRPRVFAMTLAIGFALAALSLCVVGLYGLLSYSVDARRKEIGLRVALGADSAGVVRAVLARSLLIAGVGALIGLAMALLATRSIESMLFGVETVDTITYVGALGAVVLVTALAAAVPAWRASRVDPVQALSAE
jgi:ABC-type antimicrobial peptide transport system permease subunit